MYIVFFFFYEFLNFVADVRMNSPPIVLLGITCKVPCTQQVNLYKVFVISAKGCLFVQVDLFGGKPTEMYSILQMHHLWINHPLLVVKPFSITHMRTQPT